MGNCHYKHTKTQVPDSEWVCPKCGVGASYKDDDGVEQEGWLISDSCNFDCEKLHEDDSLECAACDEAMFGVEYVKWYMKKGKMVQCPRCKGKGVVKKDS